VQQLQQQIATFVKDLAVEDETPKCTLDFFNDVLSTFGNGLGSTILETGEHKTTPFHAIGISSGWECKLISSRAPRTNFRFQMAGLL
jgi:hypothetical protein